MSGGWAVLRERNGRLRVELPYCLRYVLTPLDKAPKQPDVMRKEAVGLWKHGLESVISAIAIKAFGMIYLIEAVIPVGMYVMHGKNQNSTPENLLILSNWAIRNVTTQSKK